MLIVRHLGTPNSGFNGCHCMRDPVLYRSMDVSESLKQCCESLASAARGPTEIRIYLVAKSNDGNHRKQSIKSFRRTS